ncbi:MAG: hypothetical protein JWQ94_3907 [Tardiphaga sp.]|nr:hypothetical protein [Tardiphaga sp.]
MRALTRVAAAENTVSRKLKQHAHRVRHVARYGSSCARPVLGSPGRDPSSRRGLDREQLFLQLIDQLAVLVAEAGTGAEKDFRYAR